MELRKFFRLSFGKERFYRRFLAFGLAAALIFVPVLARAESVDQLINDIDRANGQIQEYRTEVHKHDAVADSLSRQLANMRKEAAHIQEGIDELQKQIDVINDSIADKRAVLGAYIKRQYIVSGTTPLEMLYSSGSISEFIDGQQYLENSQLRIQSLLEGIEADKKLLDKEQGKLEVEQKNLKAARDKISQLLDKTRGEQARYESLLSKAQADRQRLDRAIAAAMANAGQKSYGYVFRGQQIGREGSTGFSTGSHLHFGAYLGNSSSHTNPHPYLNSGQLAWPGNYGRGNISQDYGAYWCNGVYENCRHNGIDMSAGYGSPIRAACSGHIIMNDFMSGGFGHYIVINCGNGLWTLYGHMQ